MKNWLKYLVALAAIMIAGTAAYFSVTGLSILFSGAAVAVMVMAGSLEFAKLVTATYLKQSWDEFKGFNKWYLTTAVIILMIITSAGIFGYLSNAFQQQNIKLEQVQREIDVWNNKITSNNQQITNFTTQLTSLQSNQGKILDNGKVNNRLLRSVDNRDKQTNKISDKISELQGENVKYNEEINKIKDKNIDLEKEVGGFRFVAESFGVPLKSVVKFFIILIVVVFDPLAIALVIAFNQLVMKKEEEVRSNPKDLKDFVDESTRVHLSEDDLKKLEEVLMNPPPPNEELKKAAEEYKRRGELLAEIMKNDQELGLYEEPFDNPMIKKDEIDLKEIAEKLKDRELFAESNERAKEIIENSNWDVTLMDGLEDEKNIFHEEPTEEEEEQNFSTITPEPTNFFQQDEYVPSLSDEEIMEMNQREYERDLDTDEDDFDGFVPESFETTKEEDKPEMFQISNGNDWTVKNEEPEMEEESEVEEEPKTEETIEEETNDEVPSQEDEDSKKKI
jgi:ABC-type Co2+ transport system permease subunit